MANGDNPITTCGDRFSDQTTNQIKPNKSNFSAQTMEFSSLAIMFGEVKLAKLKKNGKVLVLVPPNTQNGAGHGFCLSI